LHPKTWHRKQEHEAQNSREVDMPNTFDWIEIRTHNIEKIAAFYQALFGWKIKNQESAADFPVWIFDTGHHPRLENLRRGGILLRPKSDSVGIVVYIYVEDIDAILERVVELDGKIIHSKAPMGSGFGAFFQDPDGNMLGLYQEKSDNQS
jgi:predicted enzyme related to lactoylglutathione lyase